MRIILASAGWQAQHGLCSGSGSGSGISTRARAFSRPRRRGRPFRQHLVRPGCRRGRRSCGPARKGGGASIKGRHPREILCNNLSSPVDRGLLLSLLLPSSVFRLPTGWFDGPDQAASQPSMASQPTFSSSRDRHHKKRAGRGRRPLLRRPRIALPAQKKRTPPHTQELNGVEGQRTSCRKYHLVEDHCVPCPHTEGTPGGLGGRNRKDWNHASMLSCLVSFFLLCRPLSSPGPAAG